MPCCGRITYALRSGSWLLSALSAGRMVVAMATRRPPSYLGHLTMGQVWYYTEIRVVSSFEQLVEKELGSTAFRAHTNSDA